MPYLIQSGVRWPLGAISPADAANAVFPQSQISKVPGFTQDIWNTIEKSAESGQIANFQQNCSGVQPGGTAKIVTSSAGVGLSIAGAFATGPLAPLVLVGEAIIGIFTAIFAAHARAVAKEQQVECAAVPAANQTLQTIASAVQSGTITPAQGIASLTQLLTEFQSTIAPIMKNSASQCNAGCVWLKALQAAVSEMQSQFEDMEAAQAQPSGTSPATSTTTSPSSSIVDASLPSWLPIAAIAVLGFMLVRNI